MTPAEVGLLAIGGIAIMTVVAVVGFLLWSRLHDEGRRPW